MRRFGQDHFIKYFLSGDELWNCQRRLLAQRQIKTRDIEARKIDAVVNAVMVWIGFVKGVVPRFEFVIEHEVQLQMQMRTRLVQALTGVTHSRNRFAAMNRLTGSNCDRAQMSV